VIASQLLEDLHELDVGLAVKAIAAAATPAEPDDPTSLIKQLDGPWPRPANQREVTPMKLRVHARVALTALAALLAASVGACASAPAISIATPSPAVRAATTTGSCHTRGSAPNVLPDPACTPGATNPEVSQATICRCGWTRTVRPPESYTEPLKRQQVLAYGWTGPPSRSEEDHLVPLELGGAPMDQRNLWPEPGASPNPKDQVESAANRAVCEGRMPLADAQRAIATDWVAFGRQLGVVS
jgi:hypothetical protein